MGCLLFFLSYISKVTLILSLSPGLGGGGEGERERGEREENPSPSKTMVMTHGKAVLLHSIPNPNICGASTGCCERSSSVGLLLVLT